MRVLLRTLQRSLSGTLLLGLTACAGLRFKHVEPPVLGLGLETGGASAGDEALVVSAEPELPAETEQSAEPNGPMEPTEILALPADAPVEEAVHELEPTVEESTETAPPEPAVSGEEPPPPAPAAPSPVPSLARACEIVGCELVDETGYVLAPVEDLLIDPLAAQVTGVLASSAVVEEGIGPWAACTSFEDLEFRWIRLSQVSADVLALELRELETAELFRHRELETIEGVVVEKIETEELLSVTLVDDNNHRHRIELGPPEVLTPVPLDKGARASVVALSMRDDAGPFAIAARLTTGDFELVLRDSQGRSTWSPSVEPPRARRFVADLRGRVIRIEDEVAPVGWLSDLELRIADGGIESALIMSASGPVRVPWKALKRGDKGWFVVPRSDWQGGSKKRSEGRRRRRRPSLSHPTVCRGQGGRPQADRQVC